MTSACALFRASNVDIMDYSLIPAVVSAMLVCDEAVIVCDTNSVDTTLETAEHLQREIGPDRIKIVARQFQFDRYWQERCWNWGAEATNAEWLMYFDADEAIHQDDAAVIRDLMECGDYHLISFPYRHFYGTPGWVKDDPKWYRRNTRLGRRDTINYRMINLCTDTRHAAVCAMMADIDGQTVDAHTLQGPEIAREGVPPICHYGWCRDARAMNVHNVKFAAWYADDKTLYGGQVPDVEPYDFNMPGHVGTMKRYDGPHPAVMARWFSEHADTWRERDAEIGEVADYARRIAQGLSPIRIVTSTSK